MNRVSEAGRSRVAGGPGRRATIALIGAALALVPMACGDDEPAVDDTATTTTDAGSGSGGGSSASSIWDEDAQQYRGQDGETFTIGCTPDGEASNIWGAGTYTDDSSICTAAVQSGLIDFESGGDVIYEIAPGQDSYEAGTANEVTSTRYAAWGGSFTFPDAPPGSVDFAVGPESWSRRATEYRRQDGEQVTVQCAAGGPAGSVWGTDTYTDDSSICTAAVHHGLITVVEGGVVVAEIAAGQSSYEGSVANGVTSNDYGAFAGSFTFPDEQPVE